MSIPPKIFCRQTVALNRTRTARNWADSPHILNTNRAQLLDRLLDVTHSFTNALNLGCRHGELARSLADDHHIKNVVATDLSAAYAISSSQPGILCVACDEEWIPFGPDAFDLIIADHCLHWTNDLPGVLIQLRRCMRPDGLFLGSMFAGSTLVELRECLMAAESTLRGGVTPRVSPFIDVRDAGNLLQRAGFALPVADTDHFIVEYDSLGDLFIDLRQMAETNAIYERFKGLTTERLFEATEEIYKERFTTTQGKIAATFEIVTLTGWAPSDTQQRPLAPGSARVRLADGLDTEETKL